MKVAVIGAGPAGMACVHELERQGIYPVVYEERFMTGDLFDNVAAVFNVLSGRHDLFDLLRKNLHLNIQPSGKIKTLNMMSAGKQETIAGDFGFFILKGQNPASLETQLFQQLKTKIITSTRANYEQLKEEFDFVVVAGGSSNMTGLKMTWSPDDYQVKIIAGTVVGSFDTENITVWRLESWVSKAAYVYITPMEKKRAFLTLLMPHASVYEVKARWQNFWELNQHPFDLVSEVIMDSAEIYHPHQVGNVLFTGLSGGFLEPFLGLGLILAVKTGYLAGQAISTGQKFETLTCRIREETNRLLILSDLFSKMDNANFNRLLRFLDTNNLLIDRK